VLSEQLGPFPETVPILPPGLETTKTHALSHRINPSERNTMLKSSMLKNTLCDAVFPLEERYAVFPVEELYARPMHPSSMQELCERETPQVKPPPRRVRLRLKFR